MDLALTLRAAFRALAKNKMRAVLTVLGIVIGVGAVVLLVSVIESAGLMVQEQFKALGTNVVFVFPGSQSGGGVQQGSGSKVTLTADDADAIVSECPSVLAASPLLGTRGQLIAGNLNWSPNEITGCNSMYLTIRNWQMEKGDFFTPREVRTAAKVCVVGATVADNLFHTRNCLGKSIRIKSIPFQVIGVLEAKGANLFGMDQDNIVLVPFTTVKKRLSGSVFRNIGLIMVSARTADQMEDVVDEVTQLLRQRHRVRRGADDDFVVRNTSEIASTLRNVTMIMALILGSVASVSLIVGGVGIMNIMLVSVTERTREIGIRLAVGARSRDILRQFLVEAVVLSLLGGAIGVAMGVGAATATTFAVNAFFSGTKWPVSISLEAIAISLAFSGSVGVFFGYYPARKASRLDPIEALRYE